MNCQRFEQVVSDLARGQMMEADVRSEALGHSEECGVCLAQLRDEETLTRGLRLLADEMESTAAPEELELKLREAFRKRHVTAPLATRPVATSTARSRYWLMAVAAALLLVMSVAAMWWRSETPQQKIAKDTAPRVETPAPQTPAPAGPTQTTSNGQEDHAEKLPPRRLLQTPRVVRQNTGSRKPPEMQMANHVTNEIATDFMPLGDMNPASLQDGGQIVRVKLRRSALVRFGFPVNMDRYNENVKADVLVGVDGLARAIRFVQ